MSRTDDLRHGRVCCCFTQGNKIRRCIEAALDLGHCGDADAETDACMCAHAARVEAKPCGRCGGPNCIDPDRL